MSHPLFPWQLESWQQLQPMRARMPHAILLHGAEGIGKKIFAEHLAKSLLCEAPATDGHACGTCVSCGWFDQYSHPDYRRVRPEALDEESGADADSTEDGDDKKTAKASKAPSKEIVIAQIRALTDFMNISTHRQGRRVILLYPAETLNIPAANALLKSLEEPGSDTVFILMTHSLDRLLPTILSRCHKFPLGMPDPELALTWLQQQSVSDAAQWLALQGGAPLSALALAQSDLRAELLEFLLQLSKPSVDNSLRLAEKMQKLDMPVTVSWLQRWLYDIFSCKQSGRIRYYPQYKKELMQLAAQCNLFALMDVIKKNNERQAIATHPLSGKLFLEAMLLEYSTLFQ